MAGLQDKIKNIVVLMLENRSFDNIFGRLYEPGHRNADGVLFNGIPEEADNPWTGGAQERVAAWNDETLVRGGMTIPSPDPGEHFVDITTQIFGRDGTGAQNAVATMSGFVDNYVGQRKPGEPPYDPRQIMHYYSPKQLPVISVLARAYAVCDQWHAAAPNQTWPNRFFAHCGTAGGWVNNSPPHFPYMMPTIFNRISQLGLANGWRIYFHDMPQSLTLSQLWLHRDRFSFFDDFLNDAAKGLLPCYSFIEPRYFADPAVPVKMPNDQHPPHDVIFAEQLIARIYNALVSSPNWPTTLFIITYDEHGGCYDHAPPPAAVSPGDHLSREEFSFNRYGVRVPAVLVSPYIKPGTILRAPPSLSPDMPAYPFDHTSIIATVRKCFRLEGPLTARDAAAPDLDDVLQLPGPTNFGPGLFQASVFDYTPTEEDLQNAIGRPLTKMQEELHALSAILPAPGTDIETYVARLASGAVKAIVPPGTVAEAIAAIKDRMAKLF